MNNGTVKVLAAGAVGLILGLAIGIYASQPNKDSKKLGSNSDESEDDMLAELVKPKKRKKPTLKTDNRSEKVVPNPAGIVPKKPAKTIILDDSFPLRLGSSGNRVERLQIFLMRKFGGVGTPSGTFDAYTEAKLMKFLRLSEVSQNLYERLQLDKMVHDQRGKIKR